MLTEIDRWASPAARPERQFGQRSCDGGAIVDGDEGYESLNEAIY